MGTFNFNLPDLGEGLPNAEIVTWHVKVGDKVKVDQLLVSVETAKAIIDIPSPVNGTIEKLCAKVKETVATGELLVVFATDANEYKLPLENAKILAVPAVRNLAKKLQVDLSKVIPTGKFNTISLKDVETAALTQEHSQESKDNLNTDNNNGNNDWVNLPNTTKAMAIAMQKSHQEVVPATIFEDAILNIAKPDIKLNLNVKIIQAIAFAISKEPILNSWIMKEHDNFKQKIIKEINLGIAVDSPDGLFVPVIKNIANLDPAQIRTTLD
ncbi:MAG: biotin/lipoyl-containing protein, partial [Gammaproteobacteria bacterium]